LKLLRSNTLEKFLLIFQLQLYLPVLFLDLLELPHERLRIHTTDITSTDTDTNTAASTTTAATAASTTTTAASGTTKQRHDALLRAWASVVCLPGAVSHSAALFRHLVLHCSLPLLRYRILYTHLPSSFFIQPIGLCKLLLHRSHRCCCCCRLLLLPLLHQILYILPSLHLPPLDLLPPVNLLPPLRLPPRHLLPRQLLQLDHLILFNPRLLRRLSLHLLLPLLPQLLPPLLLATHICLSSARRTEVARTARRAAV
jgi:hypothetical protein